MHCSAGVGTRRKAVGRCGSAVRGAPGAAGDLVASMAQTPPCMMNYFIQEMLRLHAVFVGEFMGKLALPATVLWTVSVASRLGTRLSAGSHSFMELSASCRSCRRGTGGRRSALGGEEGKAGQVVGCGHGEARQCEGHCVGSVPHLRLSGAGFTCMVRVCALASARRVSSMPRSRAPRAFCCAQGLARGKECAPSPSSLLPGKPCMGIVCQLANVTCRGEGRKQPAAQIGAMRAFVRVKTLGRPSSKSVRDPDEESKRRHVGHNTVCLAISPVQRHVPLEHFEGSALSRSPREGHFLQQKLVASRPILFQGRRQVRPPGVGMGPRHCSGDRPPRSGPRRPRNRLAPVAHCCSAKPANTAKAATRSSTIDAPDPSRNFT